MTEDLVKMVADSVINDVRVTTMEITFPRFILPEFNTHRVFSRNSASSRARSVKRTFADVMENPFVPNPFTKNQKGMSGVDIIDMDIQKASEKIWLDARDDAVLHALDLLVGTEKRTKLIGDDARDFEIVIDNYSQEDDIPSIHKQHVNRLLEPFSYHTAIVTSSKWDNFYEVRIADDAQPEIHTLALAMYDMMNASDPVERKAHVPYVKDDTKIDDFAIKLSCASCASISYKDPDELSPAVADRIFTSMAKEKHMSPFEHVAFAPDYLDHVLDMMGWSIEGNPSDYDLHGNLTEGVIQLRKVMEII